MTNTSFIESILSSTGRLIRAIIFFLFLASFICLIIMIIISRVFSGGDLSIDMNDQGRIVYKYSHFSKANDKTYSTFLLPSSDWWYDTGIDLDANQQIKMVMSGRVHLAIHKLVKAAAANERCKVAWTGPEGSPFVDLNEDKDELAAKKSLLIYPGDNIGNIVMYLCPLNNVTTFREDFLKNRKHFSSKFHIVTNNQQYVNDSGGKARLFLTVNDMVMDFSAEGLQNSDLAFDRPTKPHTVDDLKKENFNDIWFQDNIGSFLVNLEISEK